MDVHVFLFNDMMLICKNLTKRQLHSSQSTDAKVKVIRPPYVVDRLQVKQEHNFLWHYWTKFSLQKLNRCIKVSRDAIQYNVCIKSFKMPKWPQTEWYTRKEITYFNDKYVWMVEILQKWIKASIPNELKLAFNQVTQCKSAWKS